MDGFAWTAGSDVVRHVLVIDKGGSAEVHKVRFLWSPILILRWKGTTARYCTSLNYSVDLQVFARKIIRPFGDFTTEDVEAELRNISKLCTESRDKNIVAVFKHGRLTHEYYYIDMQFCEINLDTYIYRQWSSEMKGKLPQFTDSVVPEIRMQQVWEIMTDIASGVAFIHSQSHIHRDLKPRNGRIAKELSLTFSVILPCRGLLEDCGFRNICGRNFEESPNNTLF